MNRKAIAEIHGDDKQLHAVPCTVLAWSIDFEELRDGIGHYPVAIVETPSGLVRVVPACQITFTEPAR